MSKGSKVNVDLHGSVQNSNIGIGTLNQTTVDGDYIGGDRVVGETVFKINESEGNIFLSIKMEQNVRKTSSEDINYDFVDEILSGHDESDIDNCKKVLKKLKIVKRSDLSLLTDKDLTDEGLEKIFVRKLKKEPEAKPKKDAEAATKRGGSTTRTNKSEAGSNVIHCEQDYVGGDSIQGKEVFKIGKSTGRISVNK